MTVSKDTL